MKNYRLKFFIIPLLFLGNLYAQPLTNGEYFFDQDPGPGNGTAINFSKTDTLDQNLSISLAGLSFGAHQLYIRLRDSLGQWSLYETQGLFIQSSNPSSPLVQLEYFFDQDPGPGNGISMGAFNTDSIDQDFNISISGLGFGAHDLYIRIQDSAGAWSLYEHQSFFIQKSTSGSTLASLEYFIDQDPGPGNGIAMGSINADTIDQNFNLSVLGLSFGAHDLYIRIQDSSGAWSLYEHQSFFVTREDPMTTSPLSIGEFFVDQDPGVGNGIQFNYSPPLDSIDLNHLVDISAYNVGTHMLYFRLQDSAGTWSIYESDTFEIVVCNAPNITATSGFPNSICVGNSSTLSVSGSFGSGTNWQWYEGAKGSNPIDTASSFSVTPSSTTTYYVRAEGGCLTNQPYDSVAIAVNPLPNVQAGSDQVVCQGTPVTLSGSGANSYAWTGGVSDGVSFAPPVGNNQYIVTGTDGNACTNTDTVFVLVNSLPNVSAGPDQNGCDGSSITLNGSGALSYSWTGGIVNGAPFTPSVGSQDYIVTGIDVNNCSNQDTVTVIIFSLPLVNAGSDQTICEGIMVTLLGSGAQTYTWSGGVSNGVPFLAPVGSNNYVVTGTDVNNCSQSDTVNVLVNPAPVVSGGPDLVVCGGDTVTLTGTGAISYSWTGGISQGIPFIVPQGNHTYVVTGTDVNNCTATDTVLVTANAFYSASALVTICQGQTYVFGTQTLSVQGTYLENFGTQFGCDSVVTLILIVNDTYTITSSQTICDGDNYIFGSQTLNSAGTYVETFTSQGGCDSTVTLTLAVNQVDVSVSLSSTTLTANATGALYQWIDCDNANQPIAGETAQSFTPTVSGNYSVMITENNCSDTSACTFVLIVGLESARTEKISIFPNPANDRIFVQGLTGIKIQKFQIISSNGSVLKNIEAKDLSNGIPVGNLPDGRYFLIIEAKGYREKLGFVKE
jgi:Ig-like domain CHU_C associated/Secretion system C-terminal sorting domain